MHSVLIRKHVTGVYLFLMTVLFGIVPLHTVHLHKRQFFGFSSVTSVAPPSGAEEWDQTLGVSSPHPQGNTLTCYFFLQSYLLMVTVIFLPHISKATTWCKDKLMGR